MKFEFIGMAKVISCVLVAALAGCENAIDQAEEEYQIGPSAAKNVVLFIGDGMGVTTVTAARIFDGQSRGLSGEEHELVFETFPHVALVKTYNTNQQVPDSAGTATALMTGKKTRAGVINVGPEARRRDCEESLAHRLKPIGVLAKERGKSVGIVTTTRLTHATPASVYAHSPERDWESDRYIPSAAWELGCRDTAHQLIHFDVGGGLDVALGGGLSEFQGVDHGGNRKTAEEDLTTSWLDASPDRSFVSTADELAQVTPGQDVLGIFSKSHMTYVAERTTDTTEPTLAEMTLTAVDLLKQDDDGFFLMVEAGRIDHGHHDGKPGYAMLETQALVRAIEAALEKVELRETLVLVTADHSHVFTLGGYPVRGNPLLGLVIENDVHGVPQRTPAVDANGIPYTSVSYANGPGAVGSFPRPRPKTGTHAIFQSLVAVERTKIDGTLDCSETHGGEDVALYAVGAGANQVRGVIEQNIVFDIMIAAFGWGP